MLLVYLAVVVGKGDMRCVPIERDGTADEKMVFLIARSHYDRAGLTLVVIFTADLREVAFVMVTCE